MVKVNTLTMLKKTAKSSNYKLYEVQDVFEHLIAHIQNELIAGNEVKLNGLGTIASKKYKPRTIALGGRPAITVYNATGLALRMDESLRRQMKENTNEEGSTEQ
jgi:nucleoid DNA-binding protein